MRSTFCFECPKGKSYCDGPIENRIHEPQETYYLEKIKLQELVNSVTEHFFEVSIEYSKDEYETVFYIPGYKVKVILYDQILFQLNGDIKFKIENNKLESVEYGLEIGENLNKLIEQIQEALSGKYNMLSHSLLKKKISGVVSNGEIYMNYNFFDNTIEIIVVSKIQNDIYETDVGIKYIITPIEKDFNTLSQEISRIIIKQEAPDILEIIFNMSFEFIKEFLVSQNFFKLIGEIIVVISTVILSIALFIK